MPWARVDDNLYDHPKLDLLGPQRMAAMGLWIHCVSWCNRFLTDGFVPSDRIVRLGGTKAQAEALVTAGMFDTTEAGYLIHDFLMFNQSRKDVESERARSRERMAVVRANTGRTPTELHPEVPRPRPTVPTVPTVPSRSAPTVEKMTDDEQRAAYIKAQEERVK